MDMVSHGTDEKVPYLFNNQQLRLDQEQIPLPTHQMELRGQVLEQQSFQHRVMEQRGMERDGLPLVKEQTQSLILMMA